MEKNKKIILGVIIAVIIIGIVSFVVYMEFGGYYHSNDMYKEDFDSGVKIGTISNINSYNITNLGMYLTKSFNRTSPFGENYETVDYYVYYSPYNDTMKDGISDIYSSTISKHVSNYYKGIRNDTDDMTILIIDKKTGEVSINSILYSTMKN